MKKLYENVLEYFKKNWWYIVLLLSSSIYSFYYRNDIYQLKELNAKNLIFILWLIFLILPLFSELEIFGIKLKKEIEKTKTDVAELQSQITELKLTNNNSNITNNFLNPTLPPIHEIEKLYNKLPTQQTSGFIEDENNGLGYKIEELKTEINEQAIYLFQCRSVIEKLIISINEKTNIRRNYGLGSAIERLSEQGIISMDTKELIRQFMQIANRGIHGEQVDEEYIKFIINAFPEIRKQLDETIQNIDEIYKSDEFKKFRIQNLKNALESRNKEEI